MLFTRVIYSAYMAETLSNDFKPPVLYDVQTGHFVEVISNEDGTHLSRFLGCGKIVEPCVENQSRYKKITTEADLEGI